MIRIVASSVVLCAVLSVAHAQTAAEKAATVRYLQDLQVADGGFVPVAIDGRVDVNPKGSLRATSSAVRALKYLGAEPKNKVAAAKFVDQCYDRTVFAFGDVPGGKPDVFSTAVGLMACAELNVKDPGIAKALNYLLKQPKDFEEVRIAAAGIETWRRMFPNQVVSIPPKWVLDITKTMKKDGTFGTGAGEARATASAVVTLLRLDQKLKYGGSIVIAMTVGQAADGGWGKDESSGSDLETSYRIMRCYMMMKVQPPKADALRGFVAKCRNMDGGYGIQPGKPSQVSSTYFSAIILHWLDSQ